MQKGNAREECHSRGRIVLALAGAVCFLLSCGAVALYLWPFHLSPTAVSLRLARKYENSTTQKERNEAYEALRAMGEDALPGIELMYESKDLHVQQLSTDLLGFFRSERAVEILLDRLQSSREDIRVHALYSIALQGSPVALGPVMEVFEKAESPGVYVSAITLGVLYRNSKRKPRHVFDLLLENLKEGESVDARRAGAAGLGECVDKGNVTDNEWRALPALLRTLKNERELAFQAYGAIHTITGREFAGVHLDINRLNDGKFVGQLEDNDQLRNKAVKEIEAWMQKEGLSKNEKSP